jgi:hypothetical protein
MVEYPALASTVDCRGVVGFILTLKGQVFSSILYKQLPSRGVRRTNLHMSVSVAGEPRHEDESQFPAYGPIEAGLGYVLFYVLVDRATPAIVTVFSETVLDLSPSFVRFGIAALLWFILVVTAIDQIRRQLAALGIVTYDEYQLRVWSRVTPPSLRTAGYLMALVAGSAVAVITFDRAVEALLSLILAVATVNVVAFNLPEIFVMIVFFLSYSVAAHSLDRLVVGGIRVLMSG